MEALSSLPLLLGGSWTSGIRFYLTVAVLGFAGKMGWIGLPGDLKVISNPLIFIAAGLLYGVEFLADKIKYVDTIWDSIHTFIKPIGAAALGYAASSNLGPVAQIPLAMICGTLSGGTQLTKASARLAINASPEPVSNAVVSTSEDGLSIFVLYMIVKHPVVATIVIILLLALTAWLFIKLFKFVKKVIGFLFRNKSDNIEKHS
ncbi:MAG: DUF4126 domain-containing protein [Candidatus Omnitrophica bacterium]|nr:DUF4126 domain-containing protein [Candidatus Omnitrophota bacterium]